MSGVPVAIIRSLAAYSCTEDWSFAGCNFSFFASEAVISSVLSEGSIAIFSLYVGDVAYSTIPIEGFTTLYQVPTIVRYLICEWYIVDVVQYHSVFYSEYANLVVVDEFGMKMLICCRSTCGRLSGTGGNLEADSRGTYGKGYAVGIVRTFAGVRIVVIGTCAANQ